MFTATSSMLPKRVLIVHSEVAADAPLDEQDTLIQAKAIEDVLKRNGVSVKSIPFSLKADAFLAQVKDFAPNVIFNLIESVNGLARFIHSGMGILDLTGVPYTGNSTSAMLITTDKLFFKRLLNLADIPTPRCPTIETSCFSPETRWMLKSIHEDGSVGMDDSCVAQFASIADLFASIKKKERDIGGLWLAEEYIHGREFNLGLYENDNGVQCLIPSEIVFKDFPADKPHIVGYAAKWNEDSFEYKHTVHNYKYTDSEKVLLEKMKEISLKCWDVFQLSGYARVDFRVDGNNNPYVLEINANPCITPGAGFVRAAEVCGISYDKIVMDIACHPYAGLRCA